jgi:hypothetical protein
MKAKQLEFDGMPPAVSLVRSLRRPNLVRLVAQARVGYAVACALATRSKLTASPALELARTIFGARFTHADRDSLAMLATLPVRGFDLDANVRPDEEKVRAQVCIEAGAALRSLQPVCDLLRSMETRENV